MLISIRNVKFINMRELTMFITAVCVLYLNKQNCFLFFFCFFFIKDSLNNLFETAVKVGTEYH